MTSPVFAALAPTTPLDVLVKQTQFNLPKVQIDENGKACREYNHHWSGLIVLAAGLLALLGRMPKAQWARNWPLVFAALAVFIVLRGDPESWPLGPRPFCGPAWWCRTSCSTVFLCSADPRICGI